MRISDWSSDVCSSDLELDRVDPQPVRDPLLLKRSNINLRESAAGAATSVVSVGDEALVVGFGVKGFSGNVGFGEDRKQVDPEPLDLLVRIHQPAYDLVDDAAFTSRVFDPVGQLCRPSF